MFQSINYWELKESLWLRFDDVYAYLRDWVSSSDGGVGAAEYEWVSPWAIAFVEWQFLADIRYLLTTIVWLMAVFLGIRLVEWTVGRDPFELPSRRPGADY